MNLNPKSFNVKTCLLVFCICSFLGYSSNSWGKNETQLHALDLESIKSSIEIDRVYVLGVRAFASHIIEGVVAIAPGDKLERIKVLQTEQNLQALYLNHGYEEVRISSRLVRKKSYPRRIETLLEFNVVEGRPVRVASIQVTRVGLQDANIKGSWEKRSLALKSNVRLKIGDIYDKEVLAQDRRSIQELLSNYEYIGSNVELIETEAKSPIGELEHEAISKEASRWVALEYRISLGERVSFGFRGNSVFTWGYLQNLVDEQRLLKLSKDYVNVIQNRILSEYQSAGYARTEVIPYTAENQDGLERKVTYEIKEGPRIKIDSINFDGNFVFSNAELRNLFFARASSLVRRGVFVEKDVQKTAELVIDGMKEKGYLSAKLIAVNVLDYHQMTHKKLPDSVRLVIYLYEGDQTLVQKVNIESVKVLTQEEVLGLLKIKTGEPLNLFNFAEGLETIKQTYRDRGYLSFRVLNEGFDNIIQYSQENRFAEINLKFNEGPQYRVSHIEFEGLEITQEPIVKRELLVKEGEVLKESDLAQSERQLRKMGVFSIVNIHPLDDPERPNFKILRVSVQEADRGVLAIGPGLRNDLGIRGFGNLTYSNLWGLNHIASVDLSINRRFYLYNFAEAQARALYTWPWFVGLPEVTFRPAISIGRTQFYNFAADNITVSGNWEKPILSSPSLVADLNYSLEKFRQFNVPAAVELDAQVGSITPKLTLDMRDNSLSPTSGLFASTWLDFATPFLGSQPDISYVRIQFRGDYLISLIRDVVLSLSMRTGYAQGSKIPVIKLFALGGVASVRGYQELQINLTDIYPSEVSADGSLIGQSLSYVNYRAQLDLPFSGAVKFGLFLDAANFSLNTYSFQPTFFGTGIGLHYQTPIGPVNFDLGFPLHSPYGMAASPYMLHFSVGII